MLPQQTFHQRALHGVDLDLEFVARAANTDPYLPASPPTVTATRVSDGTAVTIGSVDTPGDVADPYTATIAAAQNPVVDEYIATWSSEGNDHTRRVQLVGGVYFDLADAERDGHEMFPGANPSAARKLRARALAELEVERITGTAWVPQLREYQTFIDFTDAELLVPDGKPRALRAVEVHDSSGAVGSTWTAEQLAAVAFMQHGAIRRLSGCWPRGLVTIRYDHGHDAPPFDLSEMVARRYAYWLSRHESGVPDRAVTWTAAEGGTYKLSTPSPGRTGDPEVDAVYLDYRSKANRTVVA